MRGPTTCWPRSSPAQVACQDNLGGARRRAARPSAGRGDDRQLPARGDGRRRAARRLLRRHRDGRDPQTAAVDLPEPSPLAHEILNGEPVHLPRRRAAGGAPGARRVDAPHAARRRRGAFGALDAGGHRPGACEAAARRCATRTSCTTRCCSSVLRARPRQQSRRAGCAAAVQQRRAAWLELAGRAASWLPPSGSPSVQALFPDAALAAAAAPRSSGDGPVEPRGRGAAQVVRG